jgi:hypothetical protein
LSWERVLDVLIVELVSLAYELMGVFLYITHVYGKSMNAFLLIAVDFGDKLLVELVNLLDHGLLVNLVPELHTIFFEFFEAVFEASLEFARSLPDIVQLLTEFLDVLKSRLD